MSKRSEWVIHLVGGPAHGEVRHLDFLGSRLSVPVQRKDRRSFVTALYEYTSIDEETQSAAVRHVRSKRK